MTRGVPVYISLTPAQRKELASELLAASQAGEERYQQRLEMLQLTDRGYSVAHIALVLGCHEHTVHRRLAAFREGGFAGLRGNPHGGQDSRIGLTAEHLAALAEAQVGQPPWPLSAQQRWLYDQYGIVISTPYLHARVKAWRTAQTANVS